MNDRPPAQGGEVPTTTGAKPSIAEVAAWLRRAAEQRDVVEDLRPQARQAPEPAAADEEATEAEEATDGEATAAAGAGTPSGTPADATLDRAPPHEPVAPEDEPVALAADPGDEPAPVDAGGDATIDEAEAEPDRSPDQPDQPDEPDDPAVPRADEPEPGEAVGVAAPSDTPVEAVEAPAEHDAGAGPDDAPLPSQPSQAAPTTADLESESATVDIDLRDRSEPRADNGPVEHDEPPVSEQGRRPFGIGRSPVDPGDRAAEPSSARETSDDEPQAAAPAGEPANGAGAQTAGPAQAEVEAPADEPEVGVEPPVEAAEPVPAVEALMEDDLPLTPPDADGGDARPEPPPADRGNGHDRGAADRPGRAGATAGVGTVSLFDLDLADVAARARAAGERGEPARRPDLDPPTRQTATSATIGKIGTTEVDEPEPEPAVSDVRDPHEVKEIDEVDEAAPAGHALTWDDQDDQGVLIEDAPRDETAHREAAEAPSPSPSSKAKAAAVAKATTALQRRRTKRKRYPRGQLKERIGVLRRVRAMLGVVVLTVVLGVAAGAAIGAFIVFVAFAVRSAITTG